MVRRIALGFILGVLAVAGCVSDEASVRTRDGVDYGATNGVFHGRWWNYYERGSSYLSGKFYTEADADFRQALRGRSTDTWRARTYGLHFVEYFPSRELGVCCFQQGKFDEAERLLNESLTAVDTDRAHYYLDEVKKARIAQGSLKDESAPGIVAPAEHIIAERDLPLELAAKDDVGVAEVRVNNKVLPQRGSKPEVKAKEKVPLTEGKNTVTLMAKNLAGKETTTKVEVTVDLTGPTLGIFTPIEPTVTPDHTIILEGASADKNGVTRVDCDKRILAESPGVPRLNFNTELPLAGGENLFVVAARDTVGNETRTAIKVFQGDPASRQAKLWLERQRRGEDALVFASADGGTSAMRMLAQAAAPEAAAGGEIRLKSPQADKPYRHSRTLTVSGEVVSSSPMKSLLINGEPFDQLTGAPKESFNRRIAIDDAALKDGVGRVAVAVHAEDTGGHILDKSVDVEVRPVRLDAPESRMPIAVLAFSGAGLEDALVARLRAGTEGKLAAAGRFRLLDRANLQAVLTEQQLASALADPDQAIALGRLTNAQVFMVGEAFPRDEKGVEVKARVISTETSEIVTVIDAFVPDRNDAAAIDQCCASLAAQLGQAFPRLSGEVTAVRGTGGASELLINWTREDGVRPGAYLLVVSESPPWLDEKTGEVLAPAEFVPVGRARVESAGDSGTRAKTVETKQEGAAIEKGMPAVTM